MVTDTPGDTQEVTLTFPQRARLIVECLPVVFFILALAFVLTFLEKLTGSPLRSSSSCFSA